MDKLKMLEKEITPNVFNNFIPDKNFFDSKQHLLFGKKTRLSLGQRSEDALTTWAGSWKFILSFLGFLAIWVALNAYFLVQYGKDNFDPYPFILLNLVLSMLAALQAPVILMSQNRSSERDRMRAEYDYAVNRKAEKEIRDIQKDLEIIKTALKIKV